MPDLLDRYDSAKSGWTKREATHLLWRCAAGASAVEIDRAVVDGMESSVARLIAGQPESEDFVATEKLLHRSARKSGNIDSLKNWWLFRFLETANPLAEKMTLLWHNHFATSNVKVRSTEKMNTQHALLRGHALGNFADLFRALARDVAMLMWLDGNANRKRHPNENFAREVMELFALGVGNYSESDIKEAARAFTGWHVRNEEFWFNKVQHDPGVKKVLGKSGKFKGDDILEICLQHKACARFVASKLLSAFVQPNPGAALLDALAARIRFHKFEIAPVMRELLSSQVFYASESRRVIIKSPVELVVSTFRSLDGRAKLAECVQLMSDLGQNLFEPPTVKGWEGGRLWINSATMLQRANFASQVTAGERFGKIGERSRQAGSVQARVRAYLELLLAADVSETTREDLTNYLRGAKGSATERNKGLVQLIMTMPEYQLI
jgi:uncharacterized protein (DUF1800 family)